MHFDALCTACMAQELQQMLCPGRVQQVLMADEQSLGFEIYAHGARRQLLITIDAPLPRLQIVSYKLRRGVEHETQLLLLLRKYARDALFVSIAQPVYWERTVHLNFEHRESGPTTLVVELLGRQSNVLLMRSDGRILDALRRVAPQQPGQRALLPGAVYVPPLAPGKLAPLDEGGDDYYTTLEAIVHSSGRLWKVLVEHIAGLSPTAAREIAWRTAGDAEAMADGANLLALAQAIQSLWLPTQDGAWNPGVARNESSVQGFAPYEIHFLGSLEPASSLSAALELFMAGEAIRAPVKVADAYAGQRSAVAALVRKARQRIERQLAALAGDEPAPGEAERLRTNAEWLLAYSSQVELSQKTLVVPLDEEQLVIELDPRKTPFEQAAQWFARAGKYERAARFIPQRREQLQRDLEFVDQLALDLMAATNQPEIAGVRDELHAAGLVQEHRDRSQQSRGPRQKSGPLRFRSQQGFEILVGRNARQNEMVTFSLARPGDLWLHVRGVPGAHVVIKSAGRAPDPETIDVAAQLAAYHSSARGERAAAVIVTDRRHIRRPVGGRTGQVLVDSERVVTVAAEMPDDVRNLGPALAATQQ